MLYWKFGVYQIKILGEYNSVVGNPLVVSGVCHIKMLGEYNRCKALSFVVYATLNAR